MAYAPQLPQQPPGLMMNRFGAPGAMTPPQVPQGLIGAGTSPGVQPQGMGLMGMLRDPRALAALMGAGGSLMAAGGPSRTPVSFGQGLGSGMVGGMGGMMLGQQQEEQRKRAEASDKLMQQLMTLLSPAAGSTPRGQPQQPQGLMEF